MNVPQLRFDGFDGEWEEVKLGDTVESLNYGMNASAKTYDGRNRYVRITDIDEDSRRYIESGKVSPSGTLTSDYLVQESDILFARTGGSTGKSYMYRADEGKMYFAGFLIRARVKDEFDHRFIYFQTLRGKYDKWVKVMSMRSGQPGINAAEYAGFEFNLPLIEEQKKIADFLMLIDKKIEKQREKIKKIEELKKGMMQKVFSQELRFKDENGEFGEWEEQALTDFTKRVVRKNKGIQSTRPLTISAQQGLVDQKEFFNKNVASANTEGYYLLKKGEFAYNKSYSNGYPWGAIKRLDNYEDGVLSTLYICFETLENVDSDFLSIYFESTFWYKEVSLISGEGARNHGLLNIGVNDFFETKHKLPSIKEQQKIASIFMRLNRKIDKEKEKLMGLEEQKKGFMQGMFV